MAELSTILDANGNPMRRVTITAMHDSAYAAASQGKELRRWQPPRGSADSDLLPEKRDIDARARDLVRNEAVAKSGENSFLDQVVGTGFTLRATPDYKTLGKTKSWADGWAAEVESMFHEHVDSTNVDVTRQGNFADLTRLILRTRFGVGEALVLPLYLPDRPGTRYGLCFQAIDPDRLSNPNFMPDTDELRAGVQIDEWGAPVGYHIQKAHPADAIFGYSNQFEWDYVPAVNEWGRPRALHMFEKLRADQHRGVSPLAVVAPHFKHMHDYKGAELQAALTDAIVAMFAESQVDPMMLLELFGDDKEGFLKERQDYVAKTKGGVVVPLFPGDRLSSHRPARPNSAFPSFLEHVLKHIAAGLDMPYELLMRDFTKGSYSAIRAAFLSAWKTAATAKEWLATQWLNPAYRMWLEEAVAKGDVEAPGFFDRPGPWLWARWTGDGRGWLDPVKEAQAAQLRVASLVSTLEDECAEQGKDWRAVIDQRATELDYMREKGVTMADILQTISVAPLAVEEDQEEQRKEEAAQ